MKKEEITKAILELTGQIEPTNDPSVNNQRCKNLEKFIEVFKDMLDTIENISDEHRNDHEASARNMGQVARRVRIGHLD